MQSYEDFLAGKRITTSDAGLRKRVKISPKLFPFQADIVRWALRRGRSAIFADCGLGKTPMQLEWAKHIAAHTERPVLILAPMAVSSQTKREGAKFGINVSLCESQSDVMAGVNITNYQKLHKFDASEFGGVVLDESGILKSFDGSTRTALIHAFRNTPFRLACTATPAPNDHMELGNHAEFLGAMSRAEMLAMFFTHDGGNTSTWRLKGHAESDFWEWICSWAIMMRKPSDLGYDDAGFDLPDMTIHRHVVDSTQIPDGMLFMMPAESLTEQRAARRASMGARVAKVTEIIATKPGEPWLVWCELNDEGDQLSASIPGAAQVAGKDSDETKTKRMVGFTSNDPLVLVSKPSLAGFGMNWQHCPNVAFVGLSHSYEQFYQAVRRCWRFGQTRNVNVHIVTSNLEMAVLENVVRKEEAAQHMAREMLGHMANMNIASLKSLSRTQTQYNPQRTMVVPDWVTEEGGS